MVATRRLSLDEWLAQPETEPASEYACGEVLQKPMPNLPHFLIQNLFLIVLHDWVRQHRLGRSGAELRCVFGPQSGRRGYIPDVAFISWARLRRGDSWNQVPFREAPDLAIEILSPDQAMGRFTDKIHFYLRHGVRLVWVVDPRAETVTVHQPDADPFTLTTGDTLDGGTILPGFTLAVAAIFAELTLDQEEAAE